MCYHDSLVSINYHSAKQRETEREMEGEKKPEQKSIDGGREKGKQSFDERLEKLFKEASEVDSTYGSNTAVFVFSSDGKVCSSRGDLKTVFDLLASNMDDDDDSEDDDEDDYDDDDEEEEDDEGEDDEELEELIHALCRESESEIVELKKKAEAVKDVEKKKKLEKQVLRKTVDYASTIEELEKKIEAKLKLMKGVEDRKSNGGGPPLSCS